MPLRKHRQALDELYEAYNRRRYVHPDPVEFLYAYDDSEDREVAALVASSLAFGRVAHILVSVRKVLDRLGPSPASFLADTPDARLRSMFAGFVHRFVGSDELAAMLIGAKRARRRFGGLQACFRQGVGSNDGTVVPALTAFSAALNELGGGCGFLLPSPAGGSACKRLNLMLRWLVRRDDVDPGGWPTEWADKLLVPLDTHMHRIARAMNATRRKAADLRTAEEVTAAFRGIRPDDPVRYDFALTRLGIHPDLKGAEFPAVCGPA
ncbi:MAG TPA: TIGR02757 family protein [Phycisphaerae bacterium]|nr:TIGR02757 family protein [Phycisphaerae bacterium]